MELVKPNPVEGDLKVVHFPQVPCTPFEMSVPNLAAAKVLLDGLAHYDLFLYENRHRVDYANAASLMVYIDGEGWCDWCDDDANDIEHYDLDRLLTNPPKTVPSGY